MTSGELAFNAPNLSSAGMDRTISCRNRSPFTNFLPQCNKTLNNMNILIKRRTSLSLTLHRQLSNTICAICVTSKTMWKPEERPKYKRKSGVRSIFEDITTFLFIFALTTQDYEIEIIIEIRKFKKLVHSFLNLNKILIWHALVKRATGALNQCHIDLKI